MSISRLMMQAAAGSGEGPPTVFGQAFGGGFYAGNIVQGGVEYYVIVAPKASGENASIEFKTSNTASPAATQTLNNGPSATAAMVAAGDHPAAAFCAGLTINGFSDWYMPARDELELCYRNLKPSTTSTSAGTRVLSSITYPEGNDVSGDLIGRNRNSAPAGAGYTSSFPPQTPITIFQSGNSEAFSSTFYKSSSEFADNFSWVHSLDYGDQSQEAKNSLRPVRAVRRVPV